MKWANIWEGVKRWALRTLRGGVEVYGSCRRCGTCCTRIHLVNDGRPVRKERAFARMVKRDPRFSRFYVKRRTREGILEFGCSWLMEDGSCRDHENRMELCAMFPSRAMYFFGGQPPDCCGYRIVRSKAFAKTLKKEMKRIK